MAARKRPIRKPFPTTKENEDLESLLVFGYECKQFRDDEKALYIEQGRHLIPWMGDGGLLIDRYDGRGHLFDLHAYDAAKINTDVQLSEEEQRIEALCDEERYLELHTDLAEKAMYEEEELKRLNQAFNEVYDDGGYAAVGFNYDWSQHEEEQEEEQAGEAEDEDDEPYEVPAELHLPPDVIAPTSMKAAKIVEKTAKFVSKQGVQMEILIKTKQSDNPQFSFLEHCDPLNPFYKHMTAMIKAGRYTPKEEKPDIQRQNSQPEGQEYLHPKLMKLMKQEPEPEINSKDFLESVKAKLPSGQLSNSLYAKLVSNMKQVGSGRSSPIMARPALPKKPMADPVPSAATAYPADHHPRGGTAPQAPGAPLLPYGPQHPAPTGGYQGGAEVTLPPPPGMEPVTLPSSVVAPVQQPPPPGTVPPEPVCPLDSLNGAYGGDMSFEDEEMPPDVVIPLPDIEPIIDKMAAYVAKNGPDFEAVVKNKIDERFHFLNSWHIHNKYYEYRKNIYLKEQAASNVKVTITQTSQNAAGDTVVTKTTTTLANVNQPSKGVSFSIKAKDNEGSALTGRKIMLYDSSDEEDGDGSKEKPEAESDGSEPRSEPVSMTDKLRTEKVALDPEEAERRLAEERSKDRISMAAREKVAAAGREKQLQLERKRRAAMFINMLKGSGPATGGTAGTASQGGVGPPPRDENSRDGTDWSGTPKSQNTPKTTPPASRSPSPPPWASGTAPKTSYPPRSPPRPKSPTTLLLERQRQRELERRKPRSPRKSRSRSPVWMGRRRRYRSRTPPPALPSAYSVVRRSRSPPKKRSRSRSPVKHKKKRSRSRDRTMRPHPRKSKSPPRVKEKKSHKRSKSKSPSRKHHKSSHSSEPRPRKTKSRSRSPSSKKAKKSKHRSRSPSVSKSHRPRSKSREGSVGRLRTITEVKTPLKDPAPPTTTSPIEGATLSRLTMSLPQGGEVRRDDDVIVISPAKEEVAPPLSIPRPPPSAPPPTSTSYLPPTAPPPPPAESAPSAKPDTPVSKDLLSKVRAMLKASRAQVLKEEGPIVD